MKHGILRATLKDRISAHVEHNVNPDPDPYLNKEEEKELVIFLKQIASMGYSKTRNQVMTTVETCVKCNKKNAEKFKNYSRVLEKFS